MEQVKHASMFKAARLVADNCKSKAHRDILRERVDTCHAAFDVFCVGPSQANMECLVGAWTRMLLAVEACGPMGNGPTDTGGRLDAPAIAPALDLNRFMA